MNDKLKPCPFCGGEAEIGQYCKNGLIIKCMNCGIQRKQCTLRFGLDWLKNNMIKKWNTRRRNRI